MFKKLRKKILMGALIATASSAPLITPVISSTSVMAAEGVSDGFIKDKKGVSTGVVKNKVASDIERGKYRYYDKNGNPSYTFTGVAQSAETGDWVFVRKGLYDNTYTGVAQTVNNNWVFVKKGRFNTSFTGVAQSTTGNWVYVSKGRYNTSFTGIAKSINGNWLYVSKGRWSNKTNVDYKVRKGENIEQYAIINGRVHHAAIYNAKTGEDVGLIRYTNAGAVREKYTKISTNNWSHYIYEGGKIVKFERLNDKGELLAATDYIR